MSSRMTEEVLKSLTKNSSCKFYAQFRSFKQSNTMVFTITFVPLEMSNVFKHEEEEPQTNRG